MSEWEGRAVGLSEEDEENDKPKRITKPKFNKLMIDILTKYCERIINFIINHAHRI